ncbi:MAG TPA: hypothetical protein VHI93_03700, partial [Candidatus Thermoplasmatota archaeon]|nr:hypothetical protein [Candidatus Thermoplasmatota archaeon]
MKAALRVLVLSPFPYSPYDGQGAAVLCSAQLSDLHLRHDVHVLVFSSPQQSNAVEWMRQHAGRVETVPLPSRNIFHRLWAAASLQAGRQFQSRRFQDALQAELATFKPDVVLIQFSSLAQYVEFCKPTRTVLDSHDVHWVSNLRQSTLGGGGMR